MKILKIALALVLVTTGLFSCKKDSTTEPKQTVSLEGKWLGNYTNGDSGPKHFFSLNFKAGGVLEEVASDGTVKGEGTWKMDNNNVITAKVTWFPPSNSKFSFVGAFYPSDKQILGNWGFGSSATDGGTWEMKK